MFQSTIFLFCSNCTWEIIPMLLGAWLLGFLFWRAVNGKRYLTQKEELEKSQTQMERTLKENSRMLEAEKYKHNKLTERYVQLEKENASLALRIKQFEKKEE